MTADRPRPAAPDVVSTATGIVVAVVSAVFGVCAHGLAAGTGAALPSSEQLLMLLGASAGVGAVTAALARRRSPVLLSVGGLLAGQGLVHLVMVSDHAHGGAGHDHAAGHVVDPGAVRAAMDGGSAAGAHADLLLTPGMLGAHVAAVVLTLAVVAILSGTLAWVAARVAPLLAGAHLVVVDKLVPRGRVPAADTRYLLSRGATRAPPVSV
ncbi:MAG TPA: hypothetical protein H9759_02835 [Candidatus Dietzia intestinipullorum]|nr:hypothetical protein [Candidatus Dietzia intestinipullorum]